MFVCVCVCVLQWKRLQQSGVGLVSLGLGPVHTKDPATPKSAFTRRGVLGATEDLTTVGIMLEVLDIYMDMCTTRERAAIVTILTEVCVTIEIFHSHTHFWFSNNSVFSDLTAVYQSTRAELDRMWIIVLCDGRCYF